MIDEKNCNKSRMFLKSVLPQSTLSSWRNVPTTAVHAGAIWYCWWVQIWCSLHGTIFI